MQSFDTSITADCLKFLQPSECTEDAENNYTQVDRLYVLSKDANNCLKLRVLRKIKQETGVQYYSNIGGPGGYRSHSECSENL